MPRKFLGEKIDPLTDAIRPASMTLTAEDLAHIPTFQFDDDGKYNSRDDLILDNPKRGKRLSRKFGGTMKLKQRLESVPEIFLFDFKRKSQMGKPTSDNNLTRPGKRLLTRGVSSQNIRPRNLQDRRVLQRRISSKKDLPQLIEEEEEVEDRKQRSYISDESQPKRTLDPSPRLGDPPMTPVGKSDSEVLFDEIIAFYGVNSSNNNLGISTTNAFNQELERVLNHVTKIDNMNKMHNEFLPSGMTHLAVPPTKRSVTINPTTPILNSIDAQLSTPEYSDANQSSPWSALGDEFSEIVSSPSTSTTTTMTEGNSSYDTARDDFGSLTDLSINKIPSRVSGTFSEESADETPILPKLPSHRPIKRIPEYTVKSVTLKHINIIPKIAKLNFDDEESEEKKQEYDGNDDYVISPQINKRPLLRTHTRVNTIRALQDKINNINISKQNTILSASSSVYSERP